MGIFYSSFHLTIDILNASIFSCYKLSNNLHTGHAFMIIGLILRSIILKSEVLFLHNIILKEMVQITFQNIVPI